MLCALTLRRKPSDAQRNGRHVSRRNIAHYRPARKQQGMKITDIVVHPMAMPAERVRWTAQEITRRVELTLVEVRTDAGIVGLGEISSGPQPIVCKLLDDMAPVVLGLDPLAIDAIWDKLVSIT